MGTDNFLSPQESKSLPSTMHITACLTPTKSNASEGSAKSLFLAAVSSASVEAVKNETPIADPIANEESSPGFKQKVAATTRSFIQQQKERPIFPKHPRKQLESIKE